MAACEEYAANLEPGACSIAGAAPHPATLPPSHPPALAPSHPPTPGAPGAADQLWLEVTTSNRVGMGAQACRGLLSLHSQACTPNPALPGPLRAWGGIVTP